MRRSKIRQAFVFTDTHAGCSHALCHPDGHAPGDKPPEEHTIRID